MISYRHHPLVGTFVELQILDDIDDDTADELDATMVAEMERLEHICSIFDPQSELSCWRRGDVEHPGTELTELLALALDWQRRTGGAFNTSSRVLTERWHQAETDGAAPDLGDLGRLAQSIAEPRYCIENGVVERLGDLGAVDLNAIAKGWIVDRAVDRLHSEHPDFDVVINAGGDLRHIGRDPITVGIENPLRPYDNEPPLASIELRNGGLATSGGSQRGFTVGGVRHPHLIDPRTGNPTSRHASVTVIAPNAATADVLATACGLLDEFDAFALCTQHEAGCVIVDNTGAPSWNDLGRPLT